MTKRKEKGLKVSNFALLLVVFKWHHGSDGVNCTVSPIQSISVVLSAPLPSADYKHLWIRWGKEEKKKTYSGSMPRPSSGIGCQTHSKMHTTLRLFGNSWNHTCFQLHSHPPISSSHSLDLFSRYHSRIPFLTVPSPPPHPPPHFLHHLRHAQRERGCLHGVKLRHTSGHWDWQFSRKDPWRAIWCRVPGDSFVLLFQFLWNRDIFWERVCEGRYDVEGAGFRFCCFHSCGVGFKSILFTAEDANSEVSNSLLACDYQQSMFRS